MGPERTFQPQTDAARRLEPEIELGWAVGEAIESVRTGELLAFRNTLIDELRGYLDGSDGAARIVRGLVHYVEMEIGKRWSQPHDIAESLT